jgi:hypothetical protein
MPGDHQYRSDAPFLAIIRSTFLKCARIGVLWRQFTALAAISAALLLASILRFRKSLE